MDIRRAKERIKLQIAFPRWKELYNNIKKHKKKTFYIIGGPVHGNLGDHAIMEEQKMFIKDYFPDYDCVEILMPFYHTQKKFLSENIKKDDVVCVSGGGWMGTLWLHNEVTIREIVTTFSNNQVIIFPQTLYYSNDSFGNEVLNETINLFASHKNLLFAAREASSYNLICSKFVLNGNSKACLVPDMVLYNHIPKKQYLKEKIINVCIREDCEGLNINAFEKIKNSIPSCYSVKKIDTVVPRHIPIGRRMKEIEESWKEFATAELTITDRLHAMLFSYVNNTPCIALNNKTGKVFGVYQWIEKKRIIKCAFSVDEVGSLIEEMINSKYQKCENNELTMYFREFAQLIDEGRYGI